MVFPDTTQRWETVVYGRQQTGLLQETALLQEAARQEGMPRRWWRPGLGGALGNCGVLGEWCFRRGGAPGKWGLGDGSIQEK